MQKASRKPGHIKRLLDNYRSLVIATVFLLIGLSTTAQWTPPVLSPISGTGFIWKRGQMDSSFRPPFDTSRTLPRDTNQIAVRGGCMYIYSHGRWIKQPCNSDTGTIAPVTFAIVTQPASQSVATGSSFSLTVAATGGTTPYTYQWQHSLVDISGATSATYSVGSATSTDTGNYRVLVTDASPTTLTSTTAVITVTTAPVITYGYSASDPYVDNSTIPTISNPATQTITHNSNYAFNLPSAAADKFWVLKEPITEPLKTNWYHNTDNSGPIPGDVVRVWTVGSFRYYASVSEFVLTYTDSIQLNQ